MRPHVALLGILQLVWGAIAFLLGGSTLMLAVGAVAIGLTSRTEGFSAAATAAVFGVFAVALLLGGLANAWAGAALRRQEPSGRMVTLGLAVPNLFILPFGTALGVYAFWVLLHEETRRMFMRKLEG
ncbi:MAG TPA: hypothetical protein VFO14_22110 [Vicinamibacterales bacterium]|nr:hypothetical protein [Vicinamibacterales bacterium]